MRRLTLILSDLYLPEEAVPPDAVSAPLSLPGLAWLLQFARRPIPLADWRHWLTDELGLDALDGLPPAQIAARACLTPEAAASAWFATPVQLSARLDHVRLVDRGLLRVVPGDQAAWCADFARHFGNDCQLHPGNSRGFLLSGLSLHAATTDPARLLDADVAAALPLGKDAPALRRLSAEIEMWLHTAALNEAREHARLPRVSALWLWGGGLRGGGQSSVPAATTSGRETVALYGDDPFLAGVAAAARHATHATAPARLTAIEGDATHHIVEFAPMSGEPQESLASLDENWFLPARTALAAGVLTSLDVIANDCCFRIAGRAGWRFWRRRRGWLENLARGAQPTKA
jgi:hypothetical protein